MSGAVSSVAAGVVLLRAGGVSAIGVYVLYELVSVLGALPGRIVFCERSGGGQGLPPDLPFRGCDYTALVLEHWPTWIGLALGLLLTRSALAAADSAGANWMLRGAGVLGLIPSAASIALALVAPVVGTTIDAQLTYSNLFAVADVAAGVAAGAVLARTRLPLALLVVAVDLWSLVYTVPLALESPAPLEPLEWQLMRWAGVYVPLLGAIALLASRAYVRRRLTGTFF